jgi:hypothetical protein
MHGEIINVQNIFLRKVGCETLVWFQTTAYGLMASSSEHSDETLGYIKVALFLLAEQPQAFQGVSHTM